MSEEIKLSEVFKSVKGLWIPTGLSDGAAWTLDNITPKVAIDFEKWKIAEGIHWYDPFPNKNIPSYFTKDNHSMDCSSPEELFQEFIKQYKP